MLLVSALSVPGATLPSMLRAVTRTLPLTCACFYATESGLLDDIRLTIFARQQCIRLGIVCELRS